MIQMKEKIVKRRTDREKADKVIQLQQEKERRERGQKLGETQEERDRMMRKREAEKGKREKEVSNMSILCIHTYLQFMAHLF
jgi:hypothetical protein